MNDWTNALEEYFSFGSVSSVYSEPERLHYEPISKQIESIQDKGYDDAILDFEWCEEDQAFVMKIEF